MPSFRRPSTTGSSPARRTAAGQGSESCAGLAPDGMPIMGQERQKYRNEEPTSVPHHVARSDGTVQAFPKKKLGCCQGNLCRPDHGLAIGIVTITGFNRYYL